MSVKMVKTLGCIALKGELVDELAAQTPSPLDALESIPKTPYHITVFTKDEVRDLGERLDHLLKDPPEIEPPINLGRGGGKRLGVSWCVLFWPQGNTIREQFGLPDKQFHITLTPNDLHNINKGITSAHPHAYLTTGQMERIVHTCLTLLKEPSKRDYVLEVASYITRQGTAWLSTDKIFDGVYRLLLKLSGKAAVLTLPESVIHSRPDSIAGHLRKAECYELPRWAKEAMHYYALAAHFSLQSPNQSGLITNLCIEGIIECSQYTDFGPFFREDELWSWKLESAFFCRSGEVFKSPELRRRVQKEVARRRSRADVDTLISTQLSLPSDTRIFAPVQGKLYKLPRFFRWFLPFRLAIMSKPRWKEDISALTEHSITLVVTLTEEGALPAEWFSDTTCRNVFIPVRDYHAPSIAQVDRFIELMDELPTTEAALVHCLGGKGRAGVFAACYLMARSFRVEPVSEQDERRILVFPSNAIKLLRHMRPGSIETGEQEAFIKEYAQHLISPRPTVSDTTSDVPPEEPEHSLGLVGDLPVSPSMIVCCGIPGSGKSTFASALARSLGYTIISQDELGSRAACLSAMSNALQTGDKIIVDRCNPYKEDRKEWLAHAFHPRDALSVWFDIEPEICISRADARTTHPTIPRGRARKIVHSFSKTFVQPTVQEKFSCIARVPSGAAASDLLLKLGVAETDLPQTQTPKTSPPRLTTEELASVTPSDAQPEKPFIHKFPRTRHLFNTGSATRDDLVLTAPDANTFLNPSSPATTITIEEKIDGANLGISADSTNPSGFKVQNRSHYITSKSHAQFKKLDKWVDDHREGLNLVLRGRQGEWEAGRWVVYGEWLFAKHSIHYTRLPDLFLAFDLFDTETQTFLSRDELSKRLEGTNIQQVRRVDPPEKVDEQSLLEVVRTERSNYYDGVIEGVYLRREEDGKTVDRAKIVRSDFIAGDERWNRGTIVPNKLIVE